MYMNDVFVSVCVSVCLSVCVSVCVQNKLFYKISLINSTNAKNKYKNLSNLSCLSIEE